MGRFPKPGDQEPLAGPARKFRVFDPLDFSCRLSRAEAPARRCWSGPVAAFSILKDGGLLRPFSPPDLNPPSSGPLDRQIIWRLFGNGAERCTVVHSPDFRYTRPLLRNPGSGIQEPCQESK